MLDYEIGHKWNKEDDEIETGFRGVGFLKMVLEKACLWKWHFSQNFKDEDIPWPSPAKP